MACEAPVHWLNYTTSKHLNKYIEWSKDVLKVNGIKIEDTLSFSLKGWIMNKKYYWSFCCSSSTHFLTGFNGSCVCVCVCVCVVCVCVCVVCVCVCVVRKNRHIVVVMTKKESLLQKDVAKNKALTKPFWNRLQDCSTDSVSLNS